MGIEVVVVYSTADKQSLAVQLATHAICIGPPKAKDSYLNQDVIIETAVKMDCQAIHPGFGFLSENADFARKCEENGIEFIGPSADIIDKMGDKQAARTLMIESKVPVVPGSKKLITTAEEAMEEAERIGYPVLIKASAGGGGRGMRKAFSKDEIKGAYQTAKSEAVSAFGNGDMYMEKLILNPRHIEFQILGDKYGNILHLGERDCSIQRRNQKLIEEAPSKVLNDASRKEMGEIAVRAARAAGYYSAGTIEFVVDKDNNFYFIEMNTRIQVEHPVTELVSGLDLIKEQIRIAAGQKLVLEQKEVKIKGHAIECRIDAENPLLNFNPSPGKINFLHFPAGCGVRVDSDLYTGYETSPFYDSMMGKIIVHADTRLDAIRRMRRALEELIIEGIHTNADMMHLIFFHPEYVKGNFDTSFWEEHQAELMEWNRLASIPEEGKDEVDE
jgi:acetyl-CoA carboxylase biotin carboxylase subunit